MSSLVFERIAQQKFGNALIGVPLRQLYLSRPALVPGADLFVPSFLSTALPPSPLSHVLLPTAPQLEVFNELIFDRVGE